MGIGGVAITRRSYLLSRDSWWHDIFSYETGNRSAGKTY